MSRVTKPKPVENRSPSTTPVPTSKTAALAGSNPKSETADAGSKQPFAGSKQARVISMLQSPSGATIAAMMAATSWQQHSVRGFLAGVVRKRLKLNLNSKKIDGTRVYQIAGGEGSKSRPRKSARQSH